MYKKYKDLQIINNAFILKLVGKERTAINEIKGGDIIKE